MDIREANPEDIKKVFEIEFSSFNSPYDPLILNYLYETHKKTFLVAYENNVIGYIVGIIDCSEGHIISLATDKNFRRKKVGTLLVENLLKIFKENGVKKVKLEVRKHNTTAQNLYEKLGFFKAKELPRYYENGEDGILMMKHLEGKV
ncbi:MAG: ribosomal protein S18-alanine N-acetyltransferase [Methanomicrobia archaeon]|nr:ribosomal protein S18-alanine N-acetyltransferase [Methanomicrobia archaeon]